MSAATEFPDSSMIRSTRTGLLSTGVYEVDGAYEWIHSLGVGAPLPYSSLPIVIDSAVNEELVVIGVGGGRHRSYSTRAGSTIFDLITGPEPVNFIAAGQRWGAALHSLHNGAYLSGESPDTTPRTVRRSEAWRDGDWQIARDVFGEHGLGEIRRWITKVLACPEPVVVHGHPGMAHWVVTRDGSFGALLTGEDVGLADPAYDIAWVLGEMAELHAFHPSLRPALDQLRDGFLETCGPAPEPSDVGPALAFRLAQHAYDWYHYAGAGEDAAKVLLRLAASYLDTAKETP